MILVTGGSGFCGLEIVKRLRREGIAVRNLDQEPSPELIEGVEYFPADIRDLFAVKRACEGVSAIIHTVAKVPISKAGPDFLSVNAGGTRTVLEAAFALKIPKVVHISSSSVQMHEQSPIDEDAPWRVVDPYAASKMEAEKVCLEFRERGLAVDIIRPRTVLGAGRLGIFSLLFEWIKQGLNVYVVADGQNRIQLLHAEDLADCCWRCARRPEQGTYNVGSRQFATLREDLQALIDYARSPSRIVSLPGGLVNYGLEFLDRLKLSPLAPWHYRTYHKDFFFTNERPRKELGWEPKRSNREILQEAYDSFLQGRHSRMGTTHRKHLSPGILTGLNRMLTALGKS